MKVSQYKKARVGRVLAVSAGLVSAALLLAGCSAPAAAPKHITLNFDAFTGGAAGKNFRDLVADYEKANPDTKVNLDILPGDATYNTVIKSRMQGSSSPDIVEMLGTNNATPFIKAGELVNLTSQPWVSKLDSVAKTAGSTGAPKGKIYQFVTTASSSAVFYDRSEFKKLGLSIPTTWSQFLAICAKLKAAGVVPLAVGAKDGWPLTLQMLEMTVSQPQFAASSSYRDSIANGSQSFSSSSPWKKAMSDFAKLDKDGYFAPDVSGIDWPSSAVQFATGKAGMLIQGDFAIPAVLAANSKINLGAFVLPYVGAGKTPTASLGAGTYLAIPSHSAHKAAAESFLNFLASPKEYKKYVNTAKSFSTLNGVTATLTSAQDELLPAINKKSNDYNLATDLSTQASAAMTTGMQAILAGTGSPSSTLAAMDAAQKQVNQ